jgi:hypothetical protein
MSAPMFEPGSVGRGLLIAVGLSALVWLPLILLIWLIF